MVFDLSFAAYLDWIEKLRAEVREDPSEHNMRMLARVMNTCVVQSDLEDAEEHGLLWEAIYWHLRLYYTYGRKEDLERAESIDRYRNYGVF